MPLRMFAVEGMMGLRSLRDADGTAILRAVVAANSSIADGVASALKPRRTRITPYPATATARASRTRETAFHGFMSTSIPSHYHRPARTKGGNGRSQFEVADVDAGVFFCGRRIEMMRHSESSPKGLDARPKGRLLVYGADGAITLAILNLIGRFFKLGMETKQFASRRDRRRY